MILYRVLFSATAATTCAPEPYFLHVMMSKLMWIFELSVCAAYESLSKGRAGIGGGDQRDSEKRRNEEKKGLFFLKMTKLSEKDDDDEELNSVSPSSSRLPHSKSTCPSDRETDPQYFQGSSANFEATTRKRVRKKGPWSPEVPTRKEVAKSAIIVCKSVRKKGNHLLSNA